MAKNSKRQIYNCIKHNNGQDTELTVKTSVWSTKKFGEWGGGGGGGDKSLSRICINKQQSILPCLVFHFFSRPAPKTPSYNVYVVKYINTVSLKILRQ